MRYSVYPETDVQSIPREAEALHLVRPVKHRKLAEIIERCNVREISLSTSSERRLSGRTRKALERAGIKINISRNNGRAIDIDLEKVRKIIELHKDHRTYREIERITGVPKSTAHYLIKYADRAKIKSGKKIVYME